MLLQRGLRAVTVLSVGVLFLACGGGEHPEISIEPSALPLATSGAPYRAQLSATGGHGHYQWEVGEGSLPQGLRLDPATGLIEGQAEQLGRFDAQVTVRDEARSQTQKTLRIDVVEPDQALPPAADRDATQRAGKSSSSSAVTSPGPRSSIARAPTAAALPGLLNLLSAAPEGSWVSAGLNSFADVWTPEDLRPWDTNSGGPPAPSKIILAWSGFAWDTTRGDLIIYGGGHANYPGNDVYRWRGSTRMWERASLPSDITKDASGNYVTLDGPDAAPVAAHTYDNNIYLPVVDRFLTFGGAAYNNGGAYQRATSGGQSRNTGPYLWDPVKADPNKVGGLTGSHVKRVSPHPEITGGQMWQNRDHALNLAGTPNLPAWHVEGCTGYAQEGGKDVVYAGARLGYGTATQLFKYVLNDVSNPKLDSWVQLGGYWDAPQGQTACTFDPVQKLFVRLGNAAKPFMYWDTSAPGGNSNYEKTIAFTEATGEFAAKLANAQIDIRYCGLDFDPLRRKYAVWCGGPDVWMLTPPASANPAGWTLQKQPTVGATSPTASTGTGILGKWKYIPNLDAFMTVQDSTVGNIWIYKPIGWTPPGGGGTTNQTPTVSLDTPLQNAQYTQGALVTLNATATDADGTIAAVDFYDGASLLAHVTSAPWRFDWSGAAVGTHSLSAVATDNLSASRTSAAISIKVLAPSSGGGGGTVVLQAGLQGYAGARDTYLANNAKNANFGTATSLIDISSYFAMMTRFAIFSREGGPVPDNAVITSASLELYKSTSYGLTLSAYRLLCDWQEMQATWNSCRTGVPWAAGGATGAGTDYVAQADGAGLAGWSPGWVKMDVTPGLAAMQAGAPNYGWRLRRTAGDDINTKRYYTREYMGSSTQRPKLTVTYTLP